MAVKILLYLSFELVHIYKIYVANIVYMPLNEQPNNNNKQTNLETKNTKHLELIDAFLFFLFFIMFIIFPYLFMNKNVDQGKFTFPVVRSSTLYYKTHCNMLSCGKTS